MAVHAYVARSRPAGRELPRATPTGAFADDVIAGLSDHPKHIPAKYFYDQAGSELFDAITALPEYYPTRTETAILRDNADAIAGRWPDGCALVEFGAGSSAKARILLAATRRVAAYVPVDISAEFLDREAEQLRRDYPALRVVPLAADFTHPFELPTDIASLPRAGFFPGSTLGNFEPHEAAAFLHDAGRMLGRGAPLIIGIDLVKDVEVLRAAYNDARGVTAAFNINLLHRMNSELGADFDVDAFRHCAFYNRDHNRIEMHLASRVAQKVRVCGHTIVFRRGETIHTENSYKYTVEGFQALAAGVGWLPATVWCDAENYFSVHALVRG
jgi:dimethylhistidine N-methyltransferase